MRQGVQGVGRSRSCHLGWSGRTAAAAHSQPQRQQLQEVVEVAPVLLLLLLLLVRVLLSCPVCCCLLYSRCRTLREQPAHTCRWVVC